MHRKFTLFLCIFVLSFLLMYILKKDIVKTFNDTRKKQINYTHNVVIIGSGLSGAVMAYLHAALLKKDVLVIEKRNHIGGNCFDYVNEVGIRVSKYGAHLFHTKHEKVWNFIHEFSTWNPYEHRYKSFRS